MKTKASIVLIVIFCCFTSALFSQRNKNLCKSNEQTLFAFQLKNKKWVSICMEKNEKYIVYRFGLPNKIELQYPTVLDETSWQQFTFRGYERGGGKQNAAMNFAFLDFTNNGIDYEVYEEWSSEDNKEHCGVSTATASGKTTDMPGVLKTRQRYLLGLKNNTKIKMAE